MINSKIAENYANSLFKVALDVDMIAETERQLDLLATMLQSSAKIAKYLTAKVNNNQEKQSLLKKLADQAGFTEILVNFLQLLVKNHRFDLLTEITDYFKKQVRNRQNIKQVEIIAAKRLSESELKLVTDFLSKQLEQELELVLKIDASLLGGVVIKYDSNYIDYSISGALGKIKKIANNASMGEIIS